MKFDDIFTELGEFGRYQKLVYILVCLVAIPCAFQTMGGVFTLATTDHRCSIPGLENDTYQSQGHWHDDLVRQAIPWSSDDDAYSECRVNQMVNGSSPYSNETQDCRHWVYDKSTFESTLVTMLDIVCDDKSLKTYANMILMGGLLLGSLVLGMLSDIIGRKKVLMIGVIGHLGCSLGTAFVSSYAAYVTLRGLTSACGMGIFLSAFVIGMELVGPSKRKYAGIVIEMFWCVGLFIEAGIAYGIRDWRYFQVAISAGTVLLLSYYWLLPESPRWLINNGRLDEAAAIFKKAAKVNKVQLSEKLLKMEDMEMEGKGDQILDMFKSPVLLIRALVLFYNWLVSSMVYYGLSLNVESLSDNIYLNFTLSAVVELVAYIFCLLTLDRLGRKPLQCFSMLVGGVACISTMFPVIYHGPQTLTMVLSLVGKFGASAAFAIIYVYTAELFPTTMRNSGMGLASFSARIGGVASPYIADLQNVVDGDIGVALPLIIFGGLSLAAGLLALILPETANRKLPDSIEEAKNFGKKLRKREYDLDNMAGYTPEGNVNLGFTLDKKY